MTSAAEGAARSMPVHYGHWLELAARHLPPVLSPPENLGFAKSVARLLPEDGTGGFEVRLGATNQSEPVDLSIELLDSRQAQAVIEFLESPGLRAALRTWARGKISRKAISAFWLEFDVSAKPAGEGKLPEPLVLAKFAEKVPREWFLDSFMPAFHGEPLSPRQVELLADAVQRLPEGFRPLYVFSLRSRGSPAVRLDSVGKSLKEVPAFLSSLISEAAGNCVAEVAPLFGDADRPHMSFDIGPDGYGQGIGLECSYVKQPNREPRWKALLDRLVARGLCLPEQRDALLAWPGMETARQAGEGWPVDEKGQPVEGFCVRGLSHVKLSLAPGRAPRAKVYLVVKHMLRSKA